MGSHHLLLDFVDALIPTTLALLLDVSDLVLDIKCLGLPVGQIIVELRGSSISCSIRCGHFTLLLSFLLKFIY